MTESAQPPARSNWSRDRPKRWLPMKKGEVRLSPAGARRRQHFGFRTRLPINDKLTLMYQLMNGVQQAEDFNGFKSHHIALIATPTKRKFGTAFWRLFQAIH